MRVPAPDHGRSGSAPAAGMTRAVQSVQTTTGTGINPWWRYQEQNLPGGGHVMVNVGTGNLVLQDDDMDVPHKGIALAFRRTYNSQSLHDVNGDEGGVFTTSVGMYGNGWTNTFDAHLLKLSSGAAAYSVVDIDGARYDYTANDPTNPLMGYTGPPGQHAVLTWDGACGMLWTKKSGTTYYFYRDNPSVGCSAMPSIGGYAGRLYQIIGRNRNTYITFTYSWDDGIASATGKVKAITAQTESGLTATLSFADVSGHRLLQQILFPDGVTSVSYGYDAQGNLASVSRPPNNASGNRPVQYFGYLPFGSGSVLQWAASPRWCAGVCGADGAFTAFGYGGGTVPTATVAAIWPGGVVNPVIPDGTGSGALQPGYSTGAYYYDQESYTTGVATPTFRDTNGHMTNWVVDGTGRPTQTQECTASGNQGQQCTGSWLSANETWDINNNRLSLTDARGFETDYAYDTNGNTIAMAEPQTTTSQGTFRPTTLYAYDSFNNLTAYCDAVATHSLAKDWTIAPSGDAACPITDTRALRLVWTVDPSQTGNAIAGPSYEPDGELLAIKRPGTPSAPNGYNVYYTFGGTNGVDYGQPTAVTADNVSQSVGGQAPATLSPRQTYQYDSNGNVVCYSDVLATWAVQYDSLGRTTILADGDDSSVSACSKPTSPFAIAEYSTYYPDGSVQYVENATQRAADIASNSKNAAAVSSYDLDGNLVSEMRHFGCSLTTSCTPGTTTRWYDGADRLVEVMMPYDPNNDYHAYKWLTRYRYDLSQGGNLSLTVPASTSAAAGSTQPFRGYGNMYDIQEWADLGWSSSDTDGAPQWTDHIGKAYDALDRKVATYDVAQSLSPRDTFAFDGTSTTLGYPSRQTKATGETIAREYDADGRLASLSYSFGSSTPTNPSGAAPGRTYSYDASGRVASIASALGIETYTYDAVGDKLSDTEPIGQGGNTFAYTYTANGWASSLSVAGALNETIFQYGYRNDGRLVQESVNSNGWKNFSWTYTPAGRLLQRTDPTTGSPVHEFQPPGTGQLPGLANTFGPLMYSLDQYAHLSGVTYSDGYAINQITTDLEGFKSFEDDHGSGSSHRSTLHAYSSRGDDVGNAGAPFKIANGIRLNTQYASAGASLGFAVAVTAAAGPTTAYNSLDGFESTTSGQFWSANQTVNYTNAFSYDASGRLLSADLQQCTQDPQTSVYSSSESASFSSYDAENHILSQTVVSNPGAGGCGFGLATWGNYDNYAVSWGTNGHPIEVVDTTSNTYLKGQARFTEYLHWDGDVLLFTSSSPSGTPDNIKIGSLGEVRPSDGTIQVFDRDSSGQIQDSHTNTQTGVYNDQYIGAGWVAGTPSLGNISEPKAESLSAWGLFTIQGVRGVDGGVGHWTSPDAYDGNGGDPLSQKPYAYENNNSYEYTDPTGYAAEDCHGPPSGTTEPCVIGRTHNRARPPGPPLSQITAAAAAAAVARGDDVFSRILKGQGLYRAVESEELADILRTGRFHNPTGINVKGFFKSAASARNFAQRMMRSNAGSRFTLVKTTADPATLKGAEPTQIMGEGEDAVYLRSGGMGELTPPVIIEPIEPIVIDPIILP